MIEENARVGLHDCRVKHIQYQNQILTFDFEDGYYIFNDQEIKQSGKAQMHCYIVDEEIDGISVYIYKKKKNRKAIREDWSDNFIDAINDGTYEFEFVTTYRSYQYILFKGYVWFDCEPYSLVCEIELHTNKILYNWEEK